MTILVNTSQTEIKVRPLSFTGVNLAGGEFYDPVKIPNPMYGRNYIYPTEDELKYFSSKGMNIIRLCFRWETLQPEPKKPLKQEELTRLLKVIKEARQHKLVVILDPHNYARYYDKLIGGPDVGIDVFADFWARLAEATPKDKNIWFGLINEPYGMPTEQWLNAANAAISAIRNTGSKTLILVPGNGFTGAAGWNADYYGGANAVWMLKIKDPIDHFAYEVHLYLDEDCSGTKNTVVSATIGKERIKDVVSWAKRNRRRLFLGEIAVPATEIGREAFENLMQAMEKDPRIWIGFTWWAAGPWWGDYMFSIEPHDGQDKPQMEYLKSHLQIK